MEGGGERSRHKRFHLVNGVESRKGDNTLLEIRSGGSRALGSKEPMHSWNQMASLTGEIGGGGGRSRAKSSTWEAAQAIAKK